MAVSNKVIEIGRLSQEPQLRRTNNNNPVCNFSIAVNETYKDQNGQRPVNYFNCEAWGKIAENINQYCRKGSQIAIEGRLKQTVRQGQDGKNIYEVRIVVETVEFLQHSNQGNQQYQHNQQGYQNNQNYNQNEYNQNYQGNQQYQQSQQGYQNNQGNQNYQQQNYQNNSNNQGNAQFQQQNFQQPQQQTIQEVDGNINLDDASALGAIDNFGFNDGNGNGNNDGFNEF